MYVPLVLAWLGFVTRSAHEMPLEHRRLRRKAWRLRWAGLGAGLVVAAAWVGWEWTRGATRGAMALHVLSVGGGSAAIVVEPGGKVAMFDCGTRLNRDAGETVVRAMREIGIRQPVEFLAISHANSDHFSGIASILEQRAAERFVCSSLFVDPANPERGDRRVEAEIRRPIAWETVRAGETLNLGGVSCEVLWPSAELIEGWKENDRSLVLRLHAHGRRILLTGDIEQRAMRELLALHEQRRIDLRSDVLIAPHHGSVTTATDEFYGAVEPEVVIVSAGEERERLKELVRRELGTACQVLTTHECGAITVRIRPDCSFAMIPFRRPAADASGRIAADRR
jgi:competence protein ComEC